MFRLGCGGCLTLLILIAVVGGTGWAVVQSLRPPPIASTPTSPADGLRAQQKIFDLVRRANERRVHRVTLTEGELNAFLSRHLQDSADLPLTNLAVRLPGDAIAEIAGQLPLGQLLAMPPASALAGIMPRAWLQKPVWVMVRARVTVDGAALTIDGHGPSRISSREPRRLRLSVQRFWIGRLPLAEVMLRVLLDPVALRMLRPNMPETIDEIRIEPGRLIVQTGA